jgi:hypothetical protein
MYVYNSLSRRDGQLKLSHSLCKLFACHVRKPFGVLSWVRLLTDSTFRLNSRDSIRHRSNNDSWDRSNTDGQDTAFNSSRLNEAYASKSSQRSVSVTVHPSITSDIGRSRSDHDVETTFETPKLVRYLNLLATPRLILISSLGCGYHFFSKPRSNVAVERVRSRHTIVAQFGRRYYRLPVSTRPITVCTVRGILFFKACERCSQWTYPYEPFLVPAYNIS